MSVTVKFKGEDVELLDSSQLLFIYDKSLKQDDWILNTFFPNKKSFADTSEVDFGELDTQDVLAPFVEAHAKAVQIGTGGGYESYKVPSAYLKPSRAITTKNVNDDFLIAILKKHGVLLEDNVRLGNYSNAEKLRICQTFNFMLNRKAIDNRKTLMALDILFKGYTEYQSENYAYVKADYRRSPNMNYSPDLLWSDPAADIVKHMDEMAGHMFDESGLQPEIILTTSQVFNHATKSQSFKERFTKQDGTQQANNTLALPTIIRSKKPTFKGMVDNMQWWVFDGMHNMSGTKEHYVNPNSFHMIADTNGTQCQCQIEHLDVYGSPLPYYDYIDQSKNPSVIEQICDSAPLIAPSMSNGVISAQVL